MSSSRVRRLVLEAIQDVLVSNEKTIRDRLGVDVSVKFTDSSETHVIVKYPNMDTGYFAVKVSEVVKVRVPF